jgi:hypothetical protein
MNKFISYEGLPIRTGGAHSLGTKDHREILDSVNGFLNKFSNTSEPDLVNLTFYNSRHKKYSTFKNIIYIIRHFGLRFSQSRWDLKEYIQKFWTWKINNSQLDKVLQIISDLSGLPDNDYGPIVLGILWKFKFVDLTSKEILPDQDAIPEIDSRLHNSQIYLRVGKKSTISVWFTLPFDSFENHKDYIEKMENELPFKFSEKHWHQWTLSKNGNWIKRKLQVN